ncbi:TPA: hypothetical protein ON596_000032 [Citrobacter freundii]|uniref:small VCP/p97-interacting protein n=1 Tax=Citrobacter freundii TaxID=546 RepID=UPI00193AF3E0|nr:small VCP/p97-interacting protein [Citrobacter freundii]MBM3010884.1 hypothetical protein [Citrobacter freundii]HCD8286292.1 hypothetical protein [Citrobacter freundii]HCD8301674.1 hypothetical protein [Citrobacter freundii]HCR3458819.1 hypothetical protein [Citrobacter freundii]
MTALTKQAIPERKTHDWSEAEMHDCDFCSLWSLTIHHEDGGCICASCCDAEYTSELKGALESAIDRAEAAEKRIAELEARTVTLPTPYPKGYGLVSDKYNFALEECADAIRAAGIGVKGE